MPVSPSVRKEREARNASSRTPTPVRKKQHREKPSVGMSEKRRKEMGESPVVRARSKLSEELPIENYQTLRIDEIIAKANLLGDEEVRKLMSFERKNKNRPTLLNKFKQRLH